jgi:hypothetical protein
MGRGGHSAGIDAGFSFWDGVLELFVIGLPGRVKMVAICGFKGHGLELKKGRARL